MAVIKQAAFRRASVRIGQHIRQSVRQACAFQRGGKIDFAQVLVDDFFSALMSKFIRQLA
ncbi:Uncharacterised protein [Salmonella enterica subsp. enterica serovar Bovismorbificans]|nr:Uncharacterised protein [Salmonella enterica subsp. enterica serovar Bovismorbificans]